MGGIGETNTDRRIREMNEQQLRKKVDTEVRVDKGRRENAFTEVMSQKLQKEQPKQNARKQAEHGTTGDKGAEGRQAKTQRQVVDPRKMAKLKRQAAMSRLGIATQAKGGKKSLEKTKGQESERVNELDRNNEDDVRRADREGRAEDVREGHKADEKLTVRADPDAVQGQGQQQKQTDAGTGGDQSNQDSAAIASTEGAKGAAGTKLPQEMLEAIAKAVAVAFAKDGKTEMQIALKGPMLEGVTLRVSARKGKVRCIFEGCEKQTRNLIESSKGDLMRALSKKGFDLDILRVR